VDSVDGVDKEPERRTMAQTVKLIPTHGGYRNLKSFQVAQVVYDLTVRFCNRYIDRKSRTHDQMVQAARSGKQNIAEGSIAAGTSKKTELKLTNVARASLEELHLDYEDFLRDRALPLWDRSDPRREELIARRPTSADEVAEWAKAAQAYPPEVHRVQIVHFVHLCRNLRQRRPRSRRSNDRPARLPTSNVGEGILGARRLHRAALPYA